MNVTKELRNWATGCLGDEDLYNDCMYIADDIDEMFYKYFDNANLPLDMHDEPCNLNDVVRYKGDKHIVTAIDHNSCVCIRRMNGIVIGDSGFWVTSDEVTHDNDSVEKIYKDAARLAKYCVQRKFDDVNCIESAIKNLLYRQQVIDEEKNATNE